MIIKIAIVAIATFLLSLFTKTVFSDFCENHRPGDMPLCIGMVFVLIAISIYFLVVLIKLLLLF